MEVSLLQSNLFPVVPTLFYSSGLNRELIVNFFLFFARAEYAMKRAGYVRGDETEVKADWDKFAASVKHKFKPESLEELSVAVDYLLNNPPKKQVLKDGKLDWVDCGCGGNDDLSCLLVLVRRVRNNLFHGGKIPLQQIPEISRDERLLQSSLTVLGASLQLNPKVNQFFSEEIY